jgi:hypothetical protein
MKSKGMKKSSRGLFKVSSGNAGGRQYKTQRPVKNRTGYVPLYINWI